MAVRPERLIWAVLALLLVRGAATAEPVTIFAAASTTEVVTAAVEMFRKKDGTRVRANFAASSTLARQIEGGAPADVFLSADTAWMDHLDRAGLIDRSSHALLFTNRLVLVTPRGGTVLPAPDGPAFVTALGDRRLAMGDPAHVPAGRYARAALRHFDIWSSLEARAAPMGSVREALALVARGEVPAAIVYATDARTTSAVQIAYRFPAISHPPIVYPLARLRGRAHPATDRLLAFLHSREARAIYVRHGFGPGHGGG